MRRSSYHSCVLAVCLQLVIIHTCFSASCWFCKNLSSSICSFFPRFVIVCLPFHSISDSSWFLPPTCWSASVVFLLSISPEFHLYWKWMCWNPCSANFHLGPCLLQFHLDIFLPSDILQALQNAQVLLNFHIFVSRETQETHGSHHLIRLFDTMLSSPAGVEKEKMQSASGAFNEIDVSMRNVSKFPTCDWLHKKKCADSDFASSPKSAERSSAILPLLPLKASTEKLTTKALKTS